MSNSPEHNDQNAQSIPSPAVHLGADKGKLIAAIPSLLGFPPTDSMVIIGLVASADTAESSTTHRRFRIGPVLRCDLHDVAVDEAVRGITDILSDAPAAEAIILTIGELNNRLRACVVGAIGQLQEACIEVQSALEVLRIATGESWADMLDGETGTVDSVESNELADISALSGARRMGDRREMERWLDPANLTEAEWMLQDRAEATTVDLIQVLISVAAVAEGTRVLEQECENEYLVDSLAAVCCDEFLHTVVIAWSLGCNSAIVREMLATTARRTSGAVRRRVMLILALVASANDEGVLAYHTLSRLLEELEADLSTAETCEVLDQLGEAGGGKEASAEEIEDVLRRLEDPQQVRGRAELSELDSLTADIAFTALDAHQKGKIKLLLAKAVRAACTVMANVQMDLDAEDTEDTENTEDAEGAEGAEDSEEASGADSAPEWDQDAQPERSYVTVREYAGIDIAWEYERLLQIVDWDAVNAVRNATYHPVVR